MNFDVDDYGMLRAGASAAKDNFGDDWRPISEAPRDGTPIEIKNSYGVAPTFCVSRWTNQHVVTVLCRDPAVNGTTQTFTSNEYSWSRADGHSGGSPIDGPHLSWRPYAGDPANYIDPTGGAQNSAAYWRGAVAAKYGLPLDAFEAETRRNSQRDDHDTDVDSTPFWRKLLKFVRGTK